MIDISIEIVQLMSSYQKSNLELVSCELQMVFISLPKWLCKGTPLEQSDIVGHIKMRQIQQDKTFRSIAPQPV
jgi:hypothetical protein